ncbi:hypothetical protein TVAG_194260 [Trichomonas vaginalis G3]|uniref:Uncharacterized protein n=1 Tax=Trichomonas vaginalis (strain ATCC PRA-98 / G3) TaxID=412133 RepID=A2ES97_TRIV3|nr:carboxy-lyase [Trichomonas vaginalis G3]EAY04461.1 hypothetical protein TVAG_194260 [Trichomonas vaginalis G3]KAI5510280.1 carboxy-lyase [Trichomonas vaginalis G3]|eukprot:XP_001316684.1 hypothetical protein [Trichomonas vaginalis G3]
MLKVYIRPKRPIETVIHLKIENDNKQTWRFSVKFHIEPSLVSKKMTIISTLNKVAKAKVYLDEIIDEDTD